MIIGDAGQSELMLMLINSVEQLPWKEVYEEWCKAGYNTVNTTTPNGIKINVDLSVKPGQREHPRLVNVLQGQFRRAGFAIEPTRNWADRNDTRMGLKLRDRQENRKDGVVNITVLGYGWIETHVRTQYLLHLLDIQTKWES